MPQRTYTLSERDVRLLIEDHRKLWQIVEGLRHEVQLIRQRALNPLPYIGKTSGTITARSGDTLGSGTVDVYRQAGTDIGTTIMTIPDVLNIAGEIADNTVVSVEPIAFGQWQIHVEGCL